MTTLYAVQGDNKALRVVTLRNGPQLNSTPIDLTNATAVEMHGGIVTPKTCTFLADATGTVTVNLMTADLVTPGTYPLEWQITFVDGTITTVPDPGNDRLIIRTQLG